MNKYKPLCFVSYVQVDGEFVREEIVPALQEFGIDIWLEYKHIEEGAYIVDFILQGIRQADVIVAVYNKRSTFMNFEVGATIGQSKPVIAIIRDDQPIPTDMKHIAFLKYSENRKSDFNSQLQKSIRIVVEQVINKSVFEMGKYGKTVGIRVGYDNHDVEKELRFTADFVSLIKELTDSPEITLLEVTRGSFNSFFTIDTKSWAKLLEKMIFFIPEWRKQAAETPAPHAGISNPEDEIIDMNVSPRMAEEKLRIKQAKKTADLLFEYKELGIKIQIDKDLMLSVDHNGQIAIHEPRQIIDDTSR